MSINVAAPGADQAALQDAIAALASPGALIRMQRALLRPGSRRHTAQPWNAPPARADATYYDAGQRYVAGGNIYTVIVAGTTGVGTAPSGTGWAAITDGTATVYYVGPTFTSDADAPTYSGSTSAPALGKFYRPAACTFASGAATVVSNDSWYNKLGFYGTPGAAGIGNLQGVNAGIEFETDSLSICIAQNTFAGSGNYGPMIEVDGRYLVDGVLKQLGANNITYFTINFPTRKNRRIAVRFQASTGDYLKGVYCEATANIWAAAKRPGALKGLAVTDSFGTGLPANYGENPDRGIVSAMFGELGIDDVLQDAIAGTGWGTSSAYEGAPRLAHITSFLPDVIVVMGASVNNSGTSQATINAAMTTWLAAVRAAVPYAYVFVLGSLGRASAEVTVEGYVRQFCAAAGDARLIFIPTSGDAQGPWANGTGTAAAPSGTGNGDVYWGPDGTHPVFRGQHYLGMRAGRAIANRLAAL